MAEFLEDMRFDSILCITTSLGKEVWDDLSPITKKGILTSELCLRAFESSSSDIDYSASIMPIMKAVELELALRFYKPYWSFLEKNYSPDEYIRLNELDSGEEYPERVRKKILFYRAYKDVYEYRNLYNKKGIIEFTIGDYLYTSGVCDYKNRKCDKSVIEFYKSGVLGITTSESAINRYVWMLAANLEGLLDYRNNSAHGGRNQSLADANVVMNKLIKVEKVLKQIVAPDL